ncbi:MAG TPA: hypothetical protein VMY37_21005 [Thermoguttaceae bacterium]|nr:hypothetical protein [Thermoguttaceae bacterium]
MADKVSPVSRDNGLPNRSVTMQISIIVPNQPLAESIRRLDWVIKGNEPRSGNNVMSTRERSVNWPMAPLTLHTQRSRRLGLIIAVAGLLIAGYAAGAKGDEAWRPHVPRHGMNLVSNATLATPAGWSLFGDAQYDADTSRSDDGSGAFLLTTCVFGQKGSKVFSDFIPIEGGKTFTYGFYIKTAGGPTHAGCQVSIHKPDKGFIRNIASGRVSTTQDGEWQECVLPVFIPEEAAFVRVQVFKTESTQPGGRAWADDFYLGEGIGFEQPPSLKKSFDGTHVRVDALGNFEINKNGVWTPFFPLCMYSDNYRDWSVYSQQGWNTIIWTGAASQVKQAKQAVSDLNPDGMLAGFSISQYTFPSGWAYNNLDDLRAKLREIFDQDLGDNLLLYYWDNEVNHDQWQVPVDVANTIKSVDVDASGKRRHPIYALQGEFNMARLHASRGLVDVSGTYVGGGAAATGGAGQGDDHGLLILDRLEGQISPAAFAQFNGVDGPGDMRLRLYNSIILGAKAMGYWRDCYKACDEKFMKSVGPVDKRAWWPDFPNLRREVDRLLPLIRRPHWTTWSVNVQPPRSVRVGTRDFDGEGYLIMVNQTSQQQKATVSLAGLAYVPMEVRDYFDNANVAAVHDGTFSVTLPPIGVESGTAVLRLARSSENP